MGIVLSDQYGKCQILQCRYFGSTVNHMDDPRSGSLYRPTGIIQFDDILEDDPNRNIIDQPIRDVR